MSKLFHTVSVEVGASRISGERTWSHCSGTLLDDAR